MRDIVYREGDVADGIYFIKEGELEHSVKHKMSNSDVFSAKKLRIQKVSELRLSIVGKNQVIGLDDLKKDQ